MSANPALSIIAGAIDAVLVTVFAALGRNSHELSATIAGVWATAWPFLAGLAISWVVALVWRRPVAVLRSGLPVWAGTVALGLTLRTTVGSGGAALPFVLVTIGTLGLMLLGWRLVWAFTRSLLRRRA